MTNTIGNINSSGQLLQIYLQKKVLENFEPELYFYKMGEQPVWQDGYYTIAWTRFSRLVVSATNATLTEGVTGNEQNFSATTITTTPTQYGIYIVLSDMLLDVAPVDIMGRAAIEVRNNMARIIDEVIQTALLSGTSNTLFQNDVANRNSLTSNDKMTASTLVKADTFLQVKAAPRFDAEGYVAVMHPNVVFDLRVEFNTGSFIDINKYSAPEKILKGEIGKLGGIRIVNCPFVKRMLNTGSITVYPTYVLGKGAYGVSMLQNMQIFYTPRTPSDSDPLAQRAKVGAKVPFGTKVLQSDALLVIESASSLSASTFSSTFNPAP